MLKTAFTVWECWIRLLRILNIAHIWTWLLSTLLAFLLGSNRIIRQSWKQSLGLRTIEQKWNRIFVPGKQGVILSDLQCIFPDFFYMREVSVYILSSSVFLFLVPLYFFHFPHLQTFILYWGMCYAHT